MKKYIIIAILILSLSGNIINNSFAEESNNIVTEKIKELNLIGSNVIGKNLIELEFASNIDSDSEKDISVKSVGDDSEEIFVTDYEINNNIVKIILEKDLEPKKDYEIIIFQITGEDGSTITSGLDGALKFNSGDLAVFDIQKNRLEKENLEKEKLEKEKLEKEKLEKEKLEKEKLEKEKLEKEKLEKEKLLEMKSALVESEVKKNKELNNNEDLDGKEIKQEEVDKNIEVAASKKKELVKTGPEHLLLAILSLILAGLIGYTINQRKNNKI